MRRQEENEWRERFCTETPEQGKYSFVSGAACISFHTPYTLLLTKSILMHVQVARQSISSRNLANRTQTDSTSAVPACTTPALCSLGPGLEELSLSKSIRTRLGLQPHWDYWTCSQPARSSFQGTKEYSLCTIWHQFEEQLIGKLLNNQFLCSEPQWQTVLLKSKLQSGTPWKMTKQTEYQTLNHSPHFTMPHYSYKCLSFFSATPARALLPQKPTEECLSCIWYFIFSTDRSYCPQELFIDG